MSSENKQERYEHAYRAATEIIDREWQQAGMRREDLEIAVEGNLLVIKGQRPDGSRAPGCKFLVMEINYGSFECVLEIPPDYDLTQAQATYTNGFLRVDVPKASMSPSTRLKLQVSGTK